MLAYSKGDVVQGAAAIARQHGVILRSVAEFALGFRTAATGIVDNQEYTNPYANVHSKAKAFKDRARETNEKDAERRESKLMQEVKGLGILDKRPN